MKRKGISIIAILIGIILITYPKLSELYGNYQQKQLLLEWEQSLLAIDNPNNDDSIYEIDMNSFEENQLVNKIDNERSNEEIDKENSDLNEEIEGILKIDKIDLKLPILKGATNENMKISVANIKDTGDIGQIGNYAIAGHRSRTYGRNFNRLNELEIGDTIEISNEDNLYIYTVTKKLYVKPDEVWVLSGDEEDKEITLVTCDPMVNPYQRLIIKGKIIK